MRLYNGCRSAFYGWNDLKDLLAERLEIDIAVGDRTKDY